MLDRVATFGAWGIENLRDLGKSGIVFFRILFYPPNFRKGFPLVVQQVYVEGVLSLLIVVCL